MVKQSGDSMGIQLTLIYPLYTRKTPSNEEAPLGYLPDTSVISIEDVVVGKAIDGNSVWYKTAEGVYYWSGGTDMVEFVLPDANFLKLPLDRQRELVSQAMSYYYDKLHEKTSITGMSVTFKKTQGQVADHYALVIQVRAKSDHSSFPIPEGLPFYGFAIPTDVVEASKTVSSALGDTISRKGRMSFGSAGFLTTKENGTEVFLVTNYHVACTDLMLRAPRKFAFLNGDIVREPSVEMPAKSGHVIGTVVEGVLDQFSDVALVKLNDFMSNDIPSIGAINGIRSFDSLEKDFKPLTIGVQMFGARTQRVTRGLIESCNSTQTISYLNGMLDHVIRGLIQTTAMSQPGDSGSAVVDMDNKLVGILVGGDDHFSYILPVENILFHFKLNNP